MNRTIKNILFNMRQISNSTIRKWFYIIFEILFIIIVYGLVSTITIDDEELNSSPYTNYLCIGLVVWSLIYSIIYSDTGRRQVEKSTGAFFIMLYVSSVIISPLPTTKWYILLIVPYAVFRFVGMSTYSLSNNYLVQHGALIVFCTAVFSYFYTFFQYDILTIEYRNINAYAILLLLPTVLITEKKVIRIICIIITGLALLTSIKRGGVVAYLIALTIYIYCSLNRTQSKRSIINFVPFVIAIALVLSVFAYVDSRLGGRIYSRFTEESKTTDISSGRVDIYQQTIDLVQSTNFGQLIYGHGFDAVRRDSGSAAHNDFLEVIYDFGVIGFAFYVLMIVRLFMAIKRLREKESRLYAPLSFFMTAFLVLSLLSTLIRISLLTISLSFTLGSILAYNRRELNN